MDFGSILRRVGLESFNRFYSSYRGEVANNVDPIKAGRVQIKVPAIYGDAVHKYWALPKAIPNGNNEGIFWVPAIGDKIWVSFENGDARFPIWEYGYWGDDKGNSILTELYDNDGKPTKRQFTTKGGQSLIFDDKNNTTEIVDANGHRYIMDEDGIHLVATDRVYIGASDATQPALLGIKTVQMLSDILTQIQTITVTCAAPGSPSTPPLNISAFVTLQGQLETLKSTLVFIKK